MSKSVHPKVKRPLSYWLRHTRLKCSCGGYWFPHRKGGGACIYSPSADYHQAIRAGLSQADAMALLSADVLERVFPLTLEKADS